MPELAPDRILARLAQLARAERAMGMSGLPLRLPEKSSRRARGPIARAAVRPTTTATRPPPPPLANTPIAAAIALLPSRVPFTEPPPPTGEKEQRLAVMNDAEVKGCTRCRLCESRTQTVFGEGDVDAPLMFIGEGPGEDEDRTGRPFVGRSGQLLDKQLAAMGLRRDQVYIANIVKCRPPKNRQPIADEMETCATYLERQIEWIRPKAIVTLGLVPGRFITREKLTMGQMRGRWFDYRGIAVMPTYHPAFLLRAFTQENRAAVWSDLQQVMSKLGLTLPKKGREESEK